MEQETADPTYIYNVNAVFSWMRQAVDALQYLHDRNVVHIGATR